ncbi:conserved hypothetical protein [Gloeothece citriformis PCC 7424]|uniref:Integral membrane protein n=1 Tax=Gloeothece citriformis (strain PCC 7424) TaxID=65393 RepID=B7K8G4_GLOC7|nr:hypothetical protein [Gloeothece citriformis]ACK69924.1 conserved hypothetical protein [Gloeothece citriformis PCC 7424]
MVKTLPENQEQKTSKYKLTVKQKNWLISAHVASMGIWFGTAICMVAIALYNLNTTNGDQLYAINLVMKLLDDFIIIPAATASLITGALLSWLTTWGFVKYYWVITKWIATISLITFGTFWLGPWLNAVTSLSEDLRLKALENPLYMFNDRGIIIGGIIQTVSLLIIITISFLKPWGKRKPVVNKT